MKCKICGYNIDYNDIKCPGCDNDINYLKKHNYITDTQIEEVDNKKEKIKLNLVFLIPIILLIVLISLYIFWINKNIPTLTNKVINNVISNMKDNIDYLNVYNNAINLHIFKDIEGYNITDETNLYRYNNNYIGGEKYGTF